MMMRLFLLLILSTTILSCKTKKTMAQTDSPQDIVVEKAAPAFTLMEASYKHHTGGIRVVGTIYSFKILTHREGIKIESVWFGSTPVPVDVYDFGTQVQAAQPLERETEYLIKANKNLFKNFYPNVDSTEAAANYKKPFDFSGEAFIVYSQYGDVRYFPITEAENKGRNLYR